MTIDALLVAAGTSKQELSQLGLNGDELLAIYRDHEERTARLLGFSEGAATLLRGVSGVHSVRSRVKDPISLVRKVVRKRRENPDRLINASTYREEITDLIGLRVLHLFKSDWLAIHRGILEQWELREVPIAYVRGGDPVEMYEGECRVETARSGYRSVHYLVSWRPTRETVVAEVQVRTLIEEAWSEVDHLFRYPATANPVVEEFLKAFSTMAGSADELATVLKETVQTLDATQTQMDDLRRTISELKASTEEKADLAARVDALPITRSLTRIGGGELSGGGHWEAWRRAAYPQRVHVFILSDFGRDLRVTFPRRSQESEKEPLRVVYQSEGRVLVVTTVPSIPPEDTARHLADLFRERMGPERIEDWLEGKLEGVPPMDVRSQSEFVAG